MSVQIMLRRGTTAEWIAANPILADGEPGYDSDAHTLRFGNGTDHYLSLPIFAGSGGDVGVADEYLVLTTSTTDTVTVLERTAAGAAGTSAQLPKLDATGKVPWSVLPDSLSSVGTTSSVDWANVTNKPTIPAAVDYNAIGVAERYWTVGSGWQPINLPPGFTGRVKWYSTDDATATAPSQARPGDLWFRKPAS